jgi:hypothetical protein
MPINRETYADDRRLFNRATRAIKRYVIPLARDKKLFRYNTVIYNFGSTVNFYQHINENNHATRVIDGFLPAGSRGKKVCVRLRVSRG